MSGAVPVPLSRNRDRGLSGSSLETSREAPLSPAETGLKTIAMSFDAPGERSKGDMAGVISNSPALPLVLDIAIAVTFRVSKHDAAFLITIVFGADVVPEGTSPKLSPAEGVPSSSFSHGSKVTFELTSSPVPDPAPPGPEADPHQLFVAATVLTVLVGVVVLFIP